MRAPATPLKPRRQPLGPRLRQRFDPVRLAARATAARLMTAAKRSATVAVRTSRKVALAGRDRAVAWYEKPPRRAPSLEFPAVSGPIALGLLGVAVVAVKLGAFGPLATDESSTLYLAQRMADGAAPYLDFPSSRPPGLLWLLAFAAQVGFGGWVPAQALALTAFVVAVVCVAIAARPLGRVASLIAPALLLLGYEPLLLAARPAGEMFALACLAGSALALSRGRAFVGGALGAAAVSFSLPAFFPALALFAFGFFAERARAARALLAFAAALAVLALTAVLVHGTGAVVQPISLALLLTTKAPALIRARPIFAFASVPLVLAFLAPLVAPRALRRTVVAWTVAGLAPLCVLVLHPAIEREVMVTAFALLALAGGAAAQGLADRYVDWSRDAAFSWPGRGALLIVAGVVGLGLLSPSLGGVAGDPTPGRGWSRPAGAAGSLGRALFWRDRMAVDERPFVLRRVLWRDSVHVSSIAELAQVVTSQSEPSDLLVGDSAYAPTLALVSGRRIALDLVEPALARAAPEELAALLARVEGLQPRFVVYLTRPGLAGAGPFADWYRRRYGPVANFRDDAAASVSLGVRKP